MFPVHAEVQPDPDFAIVKMETQGWRPNQEDFMLCESFEAGIDGSKCQDIPPKTSNHSQNDQLIGVFDGHGGKYVSLFCKTVFPRILKKNID